MEDVPTTHDFNTGDRIRSLRSGRIWIVADMSIKPPECYAGDIPVRGTEWSRDHFCWQNPANFEKVYDL